MREPVSKSEWDDRRNGSYIPDWGHTLGEAIWGGPDRIGLAEEIRAEKKERRLMWGAIGFLLVLSNPVLGHFIIKWFFPGQ